MSQHPVVGFMAQPHDQAAHLRVAHRRAFAREIGQEESGRRAGERLAEAARLRARGNEAAQRVRALADRTVTETLSEAERDAQITRGEADALASATFAAISGFGTPFIFRPKPMFSATVMCGYSA